MSGFTLLELLVTLALVAVLVGAGAPAFRAVLLNWEMNSAATRLQSDLNYARHAAVDRGDRVTMCPGTERSGCTGLPEWGHGWIIFGDVDGDRAWQASEPLLRVSPALRGITARSSAGRRQLTFFSNGTAPGSNVTVWLCDLRGPRYGSQVRVGLSGRIRVSRARDGGPTGC